MTNPATDAPQWRTEHDSLGNVEVPAQRLWGARTERSRHHFAVSDERMPTAFVHALVELKRAAAIVNAELGVSRPVVAHALLQSVRLLADAMRGFREHCVLGMRPDVRRMRALVDASLMLVTALAPRVGYDRAAQIAQRAHREELSQRQAAIDTGLVDEARYDALIGLNRLTGRAALDGA